ncbi:hypothetical protein llap_3871 [Limosa lapponica baueri]|uniref:Uncharacterized protein n=1 Tax=Limosa lapponica baueri TaxID=1758121 RepID=A0A2I0UIF2_LIMLA|nr:hypothetical protein llap_3871 [Limosa lapponica baueri]
MASSNFSSIKPDSKHPEGGKDDHIDPVTLSQHIRMDDTTPQLAKKSTAEISQKSREFAWMAIGENSLASSSYMCDLSIYSHDMNNCYSKKPHGSVGSTLTWLGTSSPLLPPDDRLYHELLISRKDEGKRRPEKKGRGRAWLWCEIRWNDKPYLMTTSLGVQQFSILTIIIEFRYYGGGIGCILGEERNMGKKYRGDNKEIVDEN